MCPLSPFCVPSPNYRVEGAVGSAFGSPELEDKIGNL